MQIDYTAKRSLKSGHTAETAYTIDVKLTQSDRSANIAGEQVVSLSGNTVTTVHRYRELYQLTTNLISETTTPDVSDMREFLDSVRGGETFQLDLEEFRHNMLFQSEDFSTSWSSGGTPVITANSTAAPDGSTTADTVEDNDASAHETLSQAIALADIDATHTVSYFVKKDSTGRATRFPAFWLNFTGSATANESNLVKVDTSTGEFELGNTDSVDVSAKLDDHSADYWRISLTATPLYSDQVNANVGIYPAYGASSTFVASTSATGSIIVWGAQLTESDRPLPYIQTTTAAVAKESANYVLASISNPYTESRLHHRHFRYSFQVRKL